MYYIYTVNKNAMHEMIIYAICGILGVTGHSLMKYNDLKNKATAANVIFNVKTYLDQDWASVSLSFVAVALWLLLFESAAEKYPVIKEYTRGTFVLMGFFGSYIIQYCFGVAQKKITSVIDTKTSVADNTSTPTTTLK